MTGTGQRDAGEPAGLLERGREVAAIDDSLGRIGVGGNGATLLIEGPAGIGKTTLLRQLRHRAEGRDFRVMAARGSEIERDFGFGVVRQLFGPLLRSLGDAERSRLFSGPASPSAAIFGMAEGAALEVSAAEASLYGLFWLVAAIAEAGPVVFAIDDAHWSDTASLRFVQYIGRRLDGLPLLLGLAARPNEAGSQAETLREVAADLEMPTIAPALLSEEGTAAIVQARLGRDPSVPFQRACHEATGGNPLLIEELLAELDPDPAATPPSSIAAVGPRRIAAGVRERARSLDPAAPDVLDALAVLGDGADLRAVGALAGTEPEQTVSIVDKLVGAAILADDEGRSFAHPVLRTAIHEAIPRAARAASHARAAGILVEHGAEAEEAAAHVLLCEPGSSGAALAVLDEAARAAAARGAPASVATYLRRALEEGPGEALRGELLRRLGRAEVALRDPAAIVHLREAGELATDSELALDISIELAEVLSLAGDWEGSGAVIDGALARFGGSELPGLLELEAQRAAYRGYEPARVPEYDAELPRLLALVEGREDEESSRLRWVIAAVGAIRDLPRGEVLRLISPSTQSWDLARNGRESSMSLSQAIGALVMVDALDEAEAIAMEVGEEGRRSGSVLGVVVGLGFRAAVDARRGRLRASVANLEVAIETLRDNDLNLMALTTCLHLCVDTVIERHELEPVAGLVEGLELPPVFAETYSGALLHEVRGALRMTRGDRPGAIAELRAAERILRPMGTGPRMVGWRSRLALALPGEERREALELAGEELRLAELVESPRAIGIAQRARGALLGGDDGVELLRQSVATFGDAPFALERARSLAELGAALRRGNSRSEARDRLREAADLAQQCGAERLEERIDEELRVAGAKPRRRAISGPDSLTPAERRVATAAATGASNREIAQDLFVSLRTVEMHLTNTYRKLGASARSQLAAMLLDDPGDPAGEIPPPAG
ncbi:MAG TPA: AAA family ATPase [Solirubrobacterales bacterium]|nr:AAA family ATPase [Solirubrobacterales bacterium]